MTLVARLCALCAVCTLLEMALGEEKQSPVGMIGGLLMLHLVLCGAQSIAQELLHADSLTRILDALIK